jgi:hypothetical protein
MGKQWQHVVTFLGTSEETISPFSKEDMRVFVARFFSTGDKLGDSLLLSGP